MSKEAMTLALEALTAIDGAMPFPVGKSAIKALEEALAKQEQGEPVAWMVWGDNNVPSLTFTKPADKYVFDALYTTPQPKQEQGEPDKYVMDIECTKCGAKQSGILTVNTTPQPAQKPLADEEIRKAKHHMVDGAYQYSFMQGVRYAEAAHGIKE